MLYSAPPQIYAPSAFYGQSPYTTASVPALQQPHGGFLVQPPGIYHAQHVYPPAMAPSVRPTPQQIPAAPVSLAPAKTAHEKEAAKPAQESKPVNPPTVEIPSPAVEVVQPLHESPVSVPTKKKLPFSPPVKIPVIQSAGDYSPSQSVNRRSVKLNAVAHPFPETPKVDAEAEADTDADTFRAESQSPRSSAQFQPAKNINLLKNLVKKPFPSANPSPASTPTQTVPQKTLTPSGTPRLGYNPIGVTQDLSAIDLSKSLSHGDHAFFRTPTHFRNVKIHIYEVMEIPNTNGNSGTTLCVQVKLNGIEKRSSVMYHVKKSAMWDRMNTSGEHNMKFEEVPCDAEIQVAILDLTGIGASVIGSTKVLLRSHTQWYWMKPSGAIHLEVKAN